MKIKYEKVIQVNDIDFRYLPLRIIAELNKSAYIITNQSINTIEFKYDGWGIGSRTEAFRNVDGGVFNIISKNKTLTLSCYISPLIEVLAAFIVVVVGIIQNFNTFTFVIFIAVMFVIKIINVKIMINRMMKNILDV